MTRRARGLAVLLVGIGLAGGCDSLAPNEGLHTRVTLDRTRLVRGEELGITVGVFPDVRQRSLSGSSTCLTGYSVLDASGVVVAPRDLVCTADLVIVQIPSDGIIRHFTWQGRTASGTEGDPLPAGVYRVIGGPGPSGRTVGSISAAITVELVEP